MQTKLNEFSTEQLEHELKQRRMNALFVPLVDPVTPLELSMTKLAKSYLEDEINGREPDTQFAYEDLMKCVYGDDFFQRLLKLNETRF